MAAVPCKRPKVTVEPHPSGVAGAWQGLCRVPGCPTPPYNSVKSACEEFAKRHRGEHRDAVPSIERTETGFTHEAHCPEHGLICHGTRTDVEASIAHHLSTQHGLVVCS